MAPYFVIACKAKAKVFIHICHENYGSIHPIPEEVMMAMKERWEE